MSDEAEVQRSIAAESFLAIRPNGERLNITVRIGTPTRLGAKEPEEWVCPVAIEGLYRQLSDSHGDSSLQALALALSLAYRLLQYFVEDGGQLLLEDESTVPLEAMFGRSHIERDDPSIAT